MSLRPSKLLLALAVFSVATVGCTVALRKAAEVVRPIAVQYADRTAGEAALKQLDQVNPQLAATIRAHVETVEKEAQASGEKPSNTPYLDAFKAHWGEGVTTLLLLLLGKLGWDRRKLSGTNLELKDILGVISKAVGNLPGEAAAAAKAALSHEAAAAGLTGSVRKNLEELGVEVAR